MMIKVAVSDCFKLKMIPSFRSVFFPEKQEIHYIGGTDILPLPLSSEEEGHAISLLGGGQDEEGKKLLIEHNLRLVVYIAKKFDNTGSDLHRHDWTDQSNQYLQSREKYQTCHLCLPLY